jgi:hypothetical protein
MSQYDDDVEDQDEDEQDEELQEALENLMEAFSVFDTALKKYDRHTWEQWKAGGKMVSNEFHSMYPSAEECL